MVTSLVPFSQALNTQSQVSITRAIRDLIANSLSDEDLWNKVQPNLMATGVAGSAQFDHAFVAFALLAHCPELHKFSDMTPFSLWHHSLAVLRQRGYKVERGYVIGHVSEDAVSDVDAVIGDQSGEAA